MSKGIRVGNSKSQAGSGLPKGMTGAWLTAVVLLVVFGAGYRLFAGWLDRLEQVPLVLEKPLSEFPIQVGNWLGEDIEISETELKVADNDDYLSRVYKNQITGQWASVYVAYTANPRTMLGHRPQVCYPASGWVADSLKKSSFTTSSGRQIDCLVHRFHKPAPSYERRVLLNFYLLNGVATNQEDKFAGVQFRFPNINGKAARYVTQFQISSVVEDSVRDAAADLTDLLISFFPDEEELNSE